MQDSEFKHQHLFLPGVPAEQIAARFAASPGNEIASGKFASPASSACLAANALGFFHERASALPELPGLPGMGQAVRVDPEAELRFPWSGGRHPWLDAIIEAPTALIGVESKRYEPYRSGKRQAFSDAYLRPEWGERMEGYNAIRDGVRAGTSTFRVLDAAQLVKHAYALRTAIHRAHVGKTAVLYYLYAEPDCWPDDRPIPDAKRDAHRAEIARFADLVSGDEVAFVSSSYRDLLRAWSNSADVAVRGHAQAVASCFRV